MYQSNEERIKKENPFFLLSHGQDLWLAPLSSLNPSHQLNIWYRISQVLMLLLR
jgi:hypothetical protein